MSELPALRAYWSKHRSLGRPIPDVGWEELDVLLTAIDALAAALEDAISGLRYIRHTQGDLYGVGWERALNKAAAALRAFREDAS